MGVTEMESSCNALGNLFQSLINDMRDGVPAFEELVNRTTKLHTQLRSSVVAIAAFLEAFQKVADVATSSKGATKEIGKSLTRLCFRHRSIESKLKVYTNALMEELAVPLQEKLEEWKRNTVQIDKDHAKDNKRARAEIKRASSDTIRLQKKTRKGKGDAREKLESAMMGVTDKYLVLEEIEKSYVRKAFIEERKHYCDFICCLRPVVDSEMAMVHEMSHLQEIVDHLSALAADPESLPDISEQVISDVKGTNYTFKAKTPPDSPTSDRHSLSSSMNSLVSAAESDAVSQRSSSPSTRRQEALKQRSQGSLEEEKSDSLSVYSSMSLGSNDYESVSLRSGSTHSVPTAVQSTLGRQLDRAHTIGGARPSGRPLLGNDTYEPPTNHRATISEYGSMGTAPPRPQRMSSYDGCPPQGSMRRTSSTSNRSSIPPPKTRSKPKPVAMPSVPFMDTEPIYMNTQELAAKIAARKKMEQDAEFAVVTSSTTTPSQENKNSRPPTTKDEEIKAQNDALADAIKELEASTAALNDCLDESSSRQSVVSSSGYGTTTSNSSASEELQLITTHDTLDNQLQVNMPHSSLSNHPISEEHIDTLKLSEEHIDTLKLSADTKSQKPLNETHDINLPEAVSQETNLTEARHANELNTESAGVEVTNWAGKAVMRRGTGSVKPPPPVRRSSSVTASMNCAQERASNGGQRLSKPPVLSPKPKLSSSADSRVSSRTSSSSVTSETFPSPPPLQAQNQDEDPYAVPMNCTPIDSSMLPPPPPEFGLEDFSDGVLPFNICDLPPPLPDSPAPLYLTSQQTQPPNTSVKLTSTTANKPAAPWEQGSSRLPRSNSKGETPPPTLAKKSNKLNSNFLSQLNTTLGSQGQIGPTSAPSNVHRPSSTIETLKNNKTRDSPPRGSLLSQIHTGVQLKKAANVNDRSAPSVR